MGIMVSSEFHTTNLVRLQTAIRAPKIKQISLGRPYKAIIMILLNGGADTHNLVMPHSGCTGADLNAEYSEVRGNLTIQKSEMLTVTSQTANPCTTYGLHPKLPLLRDLYNEGDASIFLNLGAMVEPMSKAQYKDGSKKKPLGLFGHFQMQKNAQSAHAQKAGAKGIGGRMMTALGKHAEPYKRSMYSTNGNMKATEGGHQAATIIDKYADAGVVRFQSHDLHSSKIASVLSDQKATSVFAETHATSMLDAMNSTQQLATILGDVTLTETFPTSQIGRQAKQVAKLIKSRTELGAERDFFIMEDYGYDTHFDMKEGLVNKLTDMNAALDSLVKEVKAEGIWDDVVILPVSDFSRTLTTNGAGTDHGWAGNTSVLGGQVRQQFLGTYPSLTESSAHVLDRTGRLLPDLGWEAVYNPIAEWFGVNDEHMDEVLPNKANFDSDAIFRKEQLFELTPSPSTAPSSSPSAEPSSNTGPSPTSEPTSAPTKTPTSTPSSAPSSDPTSMPSGLPSAMPSSQPSSAPSSEPSSMPSGLPTSMPSLQPSSAPSSDPTSMLSSMPSAEPSSQPSSAPSDAPTNSCENMLDPNKCKKCKPLHKKCKKCEKSNLKKCKNACKYTYKIKTFQGLPIYDGGEYVYSKSKVCMTECCKGELFANMEDDELKACKKSKKKECKKCKKEKKACLEKIDMGPTVCGVDTSIKLDGEETSGEETGGSGVG